MNKTGKKANTLPTHKPRPLVDLLVSIIIPSVILMKFSSDEALGASTALLAHFHFL